MSWNDDLSSMLPTSFGKKTKSASAAPAKTGEDDTDWDALRSFMPTSFGKQEKKKNVTSVFEKTKREDVDSEIVPRKRQRGDDNGALKVENDHLKANDESDDDDDDSDDDSDDDILDGDSAQEQELPISHEIQLKDHHRTVSALALEPSGSRLVSGAYDYDVKFWDFAGMDASYKPFRTIEPVAGHKIHDLHYSNSGDSFLIISGSARAKLFDRDGYEITEYAKGDPYIRDLRKTDGHISSLTSGAWHPHEKNTFITASQDSTIRIWDVENKRKQKDVIMYKSKERGGRTVVTATAYSKDGKMIAGACQDGTLNVWASNGPFTRAVHSLENAHVNGTETSSVVFSMDNHTFVTRGGDDTVKVWDIRNFKKPVSVANDLATINPETNVIFSPDERLILTGTAVKKGEGYGKLVMMDRDTLEIRRTMSITQSSVVRVLWHAKINQIITGSADGNIGVYYSPTASVRGAKLSVVREPKKRAVDDYEIDRPIITPHALPMFKEERARSTKRKREKLRNDPKASRRPEMPMSGPGRGGRVGTNTQQHVIKSLSRDTTRDEDPREALLKYAAVSEDDPVWVGKAYQKTQPQAVFEKDEDDDSDDDE